MHCERPLLKLGSHRFQQPTPYQNGVTSANNYTIILGFKEADGDPNRPVFFQNAGVSMNRYNREVPTALQNRNLE